MPTLVVLLPSRQRLQAGQSGVAGSTAAGGEYDYVMTVDGLNVHSSGRAAVALLPRADQVVALLPAADVSWHRITCPRTGSRKMRAALAGLLEEALLDDADRLHFALSPGAQGGSPAWAVVTDRDSLAMHLAAIQSAGLRVDRVAPALWPDEPPSAHIDTSGGDIDATSIRVALSDADGVRLLPLRGNLVRALIPVDVRVTATPAAATAAERWLGRPVQVQTDAESALQAVRSRWNLRQFDFASRHRGLSALRDARRRFFAAEWRPVRWGLVAVVGVQVLGLNVAAWQLKSDLAAKRAQMTQLLTAAHPQVRAVFDPAVQMQRETDLLRTAAGRSGDADLEAALRAASSGWPADQPVQTLSYEGARLTLAIPGWDESQIAGFRDALATAGWSVEAADGRVTLSRGASREPNS
jgi:general secretion pathway protein L